MNGNGKFKWGLPHVYWRCKPHFLNSKAQWQQYGWKPSKNAAPIAWTWLRGASFKLYHLTLCQPIRGASAEKRRLEHGFTEDRVAEMWLPVQLSLGIASPKQKVPTASDYPSDMPFAALFASALLGAEPVELYKSWKKSKKNEFCAQNLFISEDN